MTYNVNMSVELCTCHIGSTGGPCKHQYIVMRHFNMKAWNFVPVQDAEMRMFLYTLGTGANDVDSQWFQPLHREPSSDLPTPSVSGVPHSMEVGDSEVSENEVEAPSAQMDEDESIDDKKEEAEQLAQQIGACFESLKQKLLSNPSYFAKPAKTFLTTFTNICTDSAMVSALSSFGKYTGVSKAAGFSNGVRGLSAIKRIGVQPTALARRKRAFGGKKQATLGCPPKEVKSSGKGKDLALSLLPKRKPKAPHNLAQCVDRNVQLGKNHSAK